MLNFFRSSLPVIESMCKVSLPSTLVKTLYIFFDLSHSSDENSEMLKDKLHPLFFSVR